jgi:hypothetical protein
MPIHNKSLRRRSLPNLTTVIVLAGATSVACGSDGASNAGVDAGTEGSGGFGIDGATPSQGGASGRGGTSADSGGAPSGFSGSGGALGQGGALTGTGGAATGGSMAAGGTQASGGTTAAGGAGGAQGCVVGQTCTFDLQGSAWTIPNRIPDIANSEQQYYLTNNVTFAGGLMNFTVKKDTSQPSYSYTSGIAFWDTFSYQYGKLRVRAKFPGGTGPWPTLWLLDHSCQAQFHTDPDAGACIKVLEIDFAEPLGSDFAHINQQIHDPFAGEHPQCNAAISDGSVNWHTYGFDWSAGKAVFLVDEVVTCTITNNVPATPMFLIMNVALGGIGGGTVNAATLPQTMQVSSVTLEQ